MRCKDPFGLSGRTSIGVLAKNPRAIEIINRNMEDDILLLSHVALEFAPDKSLEELWGGTNIRGALKRKNWDDDEIALRYQHILEEFQALEEI